MKLKDIYLPYLPAIITLVGAVLVGLGLWLGWWDPTTVAFQQLRFFGALLAGLGALWSAHNQIQGAATAKERDEKIIALSEQLHGQLTGGDSFCYGYPLFEGGSVFRWIFTHSGPYPLTDVSVRIFDLGKSLQEQGIGRNLTFRAIFPGKAAISIAVDSRLPSHGYNLHFTARNGSWLQEIRWTEMPGVLAVANRVVREGDFISNPLLLSVSPEFPGQTPTNDAWNQLPPYTATTPDTLG
jgi:hypothetical protein